LARSRLSIALEGNAPGLPETGGIVVLNPPAEFDAGPLEPSRLVLEQGFSPAHQTLARRGFSVTRAADGRFGAALVFLPRARDLARAMVARASALTGGGLVLVDGQKTDGIVAMAKAIGARVRLGGSLSKAHGKLVWFTGGDFTDWQARPRQVGDAALGHFVTRPGVFSADGPDPASQALAAVLPENLAGQGADLGAGWGYLARAILGRPGVTGLDLVEADAAALACARENIPDARARFHWDDATRWRPEALLDFVITNPPFHTGRTGEPELGRAFIRAAAAMLLPRGQLWLVANRHLPYEATLAQAFRKVGQIDAPRGFKLFCAHGPRPVGRNMR